MKLLILRPEPGASATAREAAALDLNAIVSPLFSVEPFAWDPPDPTEFDAVMMTSANAARCGGHDLARYAHLPAYAVGNATAAAMREAGFPVARSGDRDAAALLTEIREAGCRRVFHPCGEHRTLPDDTGLTLLSVPVYASRAVSSLSPAASDAARDGAIALLHSPRAAARFAELLDAKGVARARIAIIAISDAAARAAGSGWKSVAVAPTPSDPAMLAIARGLCQNLGR